MDFAKRSLPLVLFCTLFFALPAQNILISYVKSDSLFVCNSDTFSIKIQNNNAAILSGASLTLSLPAGLLYESGSVSGAGQQNISNLAAPVFSLPNVAANQSVTVQILLKADCAAADILDAGQLFVAQLSVNSSLGNAQVTTTSIPVETGAIVVESISPQVLSGERFDTLFRTICVKNTRLGKIGNLFFEDSHQEGIETSIIGATSQNVTPVFYSTTFDGSLFETVGNGDIWLDQNEQVCLTEKIVITGCGTPEFTNTSILRLGWGCDGSICRYDSVLAFVEVKTSTKVPNLVFEQIWAPPTDYCGGIPAVMGFKISNIGLAEANNVFVNFSLVEGIGEAGIKLNSIRLETSSGIIPLVANTVELANLNTCNLEVLKKASVLLISVPAGETVRLLFDVMTCVEECGDVQPGFKADYFYTKECPANSFVSDNVLITPPLGYVVGRDIKLATGNCFESGASYPFFYVARSSYLLEDGFWHLELELPLGLTFNDSCGVLLDNTAPALFQITPLANGKSMVHLAWATPLSADTAELIFCLKYICQLGMNCVSQTISQNGGVLEFGGCCRLPVVEQSYWSPALSTTKACGIGTCSTFYPNVNRNCEPNGPGNSPLNPDPDTEVRLKDWWDVYRLNYGFTDQDDDRHADLPLSSTTALEARSDRFLAGDTLRVEYQAVMDSAYQLDTIYRAIWHEITTTDMALSGNDVFDVANAQFSFVDSTKFSLLGTTIKIRYANGSSTSFQWDGLKYIDDKNFFQIVAPNTLPPTPLDNLASEKFFFVFAIDQMFVQGLVPKPFLELGDSIFIYTDFHIKLNFKPGSGNNPDPPMVGFRTATSKGGLIFAWNTKPFKPLQYSGWKRDLEANVHSIKPCENSSDSKKFRYSMRIARENMFSNEVRPLATISNYSQLVPNGLELASAQLEYLVLQDSVPFLSQLPLGFSETPGFLAIDFDPAFAQPVDEGFALRTKLSFKPNCQFTRPDSSIQFIETSFVNQLNGDITTDTKSIKNSIGFFSNTPRLKLLSSDTILYTPTNAFEVDFSLNNAVVPPAPAAWVAVVSPSGLANGFELIKTPQNQVITGVNGFYQLGAITGLSTQNFTLKGLNVSCETDSLWLIFGWGCTPISSLAEGDCGRDTVLIELHLERPELELDILQEPDNLTLCDTSDWFEFEVYNAKIGYAYGLEASAKLPDGLKIVPGLCQISYPEGAPWVTISDPILLPGNLYQWPLAAIQSLIAANGLPGVNLAPQNTFHIRFKTIAECGAVINSPIIYGASGAEPCGRQSNLLNKSGEPLKIAGLNPSYGVQLSIQPIGNQSLTCGSEQEFSVNLSLLGTPGLGDSVYISLPQGVTVLANTYTPGQNAPAGPITLNGQGFQLALPILQGGGTMSFTFKASIGAGAGCNDQTIIAQTRVRTEAFCQSLGAPCTVYISTGEAILNLQVSPTQLSLSGPSLSLENGSISGTLTVQNIGQNDAQGAVVQIWQDLNGDGMISGTDLLLQTLQTAQILNPGANAILSGLIPGLDSTQLCGLLFVLPAQENCTCADQVIPVQQLSLMHSAQVFCSLDPVNLGVPNQAGFTYQWTGPTGLSCLNCSNPVFTPDPNLPPGTVQIFTLLESSADCQVSHVFEVSFGATATATASNSPICKGNTSVLSVISGAGNLYNWAGPGIQNPAAATQAVQPNSNSVYSVTVTFPNGCTAIASAEVLVLSPDTVQLSGLSTCEGVAVNVLGTVTATPGVYQQVLVNVDGCDSLVLQQLSILPKPQTEELISFCLGDSVQVADSVFTQSGEICRVFTSVNGCDSTHCFKITALPPPVLTPQDTVFGSFGQIITLSGPNGFITYVWEPAPTPPCLDCPTVTYTADSSGYQEYHLTVTNADGCSGELVFLVLVAPPCETDSLRIPNAFTPNGDGANDVFRVVPYEGSEVVSSLEIYDRWGVKVYENQGNASWDGTINGQPGPSDVYVYIARLSCGDQVKKRVGDVTLLR